VATDPNADPEVAELLRRGWRVAAPMEPRRRVTEGLIGLAFLVAALALAVLADADRSWNAGHAIVLTALFALATRVQFDVGAGYTVPTQAVFVPMLLLLPTPWVPLLVAAGWLLGKLLELREGDIHPDRLLLVLPNSWFAIGPALVLVAADAQTPDWDDWPIYLAALASQFVFDLASSELREWFGRGIAPRLQLQLLGWVQAIDALLACLGLLAAFAALTWEYAYLLIVPPAGLLVFYARERARRLANALALADAARERQELVASASHELVTPLAVLIGLTDRLAPGRRMDDNRREQVHAAMSRELVQLRQLVRQFVDYTRLKTERDLALQVSVTEVRPVVDEIATALVGSATLDLRLEPGLTATVDRERLHQMLLGLIGSAMKASPGSPGVRLEGRSAGSGVELVVHGPGPAPAAPFAEGGPEGLGLYVTRELARAQGGDVAVVTAAEGTRYTLSLPRGG
jgi:signal transduction histidine kinase